MVRGARGFGHRDESSWKGRGEREKDKGEGRAQRVAGVVAAATTIGVGSEGAGTQGDDAAEVGRTVGRTECGSDGMAEAEEGRPCDHSRNIHVASSSV